MTGNHGLWVSRRQAFRGVVLPHLDPCYPGDHVGDDGTRHYSPRRAGGGAGLGYDLTLTGLQMRHPVFQRRQARIDGF